MKEGISVKDEENLNRKKKKAPSGSIWEIANRCHVGNWLEVRLGKWSGAKSDRGYSIEQSQPGPCVYGPYILVKGAIRKHSGKKKKSL